jgi:hypothetical protein
VKPYRETENCEHFVEALGPVYHDSNVAAASSQACSSSPREDRRAAGTANGNRLHDVVHVPGNHHAERNLPVIGAVGGIQGAAAHVEPDLSPDRFAKLGGKRRGIDEEWSRFSAGSSAVRRCLHGHRALLVPRLGSDGIPLGVLALELNSQARPAQVGTELPAAGHRCTVEKHVLDPIVIVEVLEMANVQQRTNDSYVKSRCAVRRQRQ